MFVFDSRDRDQERCGIAAEELHRFSSKIADYDIPLLIFANSKTVREL